ncbi:MAG: 4Fe-4S dicluster domain-containing protein [Planctomycetota bacterium]|jgi:electron transport complex protein RnfC
MIFRRYGTFTGGIDLPADKDATLALQIARAPKLDRLRVPLAACGAPAAEPVVTPGQQVAQGQRIAVARKKSGVDVFAPLAGKVEAMTTATVAGRYGPAVSPAIELTELAKPKALGAAKEVFDWRAADVEALLSRIAASGVTTYTHGGEPLWRFVRRARENNVAVLIANVMEDQPYVTADHRLMAEHGRDVLGGLALLARAIEARKAYLAADRRRTGDYRDSSQSAEDYGIEQVALPHKYPTGADAIVVKILTRAETPPGRSTMDVGAAVLDAASCFAAYRRIACGVAATSRVVTVSGEGVAAAGNFYVPFGAGCVDLAGRPDRPVLHGGPMTGFCCADDVVVGPATNAVLAIETAATPVPGPCIRCAWCRNHCPTRLNVAAMNDAFELAQIDLAERLGAMACLECGVCSYVCPARLPLTERMKQLKHAIGGRSASCAAAG